MDEWAVGRAVVGMGLGVCVGRLHAGRSQRLFRFSWRRLASNPPGRPGGRLRAGRSLGFFRFSSKSLATSGAQPSRPAGGKAARRTFSKIVQVFFEIPGGVRRAAPLAGRGEGCAPDAPGDFQGNLKNRDVRRAEGERERLL